MNSREMKKQALKEVLTSLNLQENVKKIIENELPKLIEGFKRSNPMFGMFLSESVVNNLVDESSKQLITEMPRLENQLVDAILTEKGETTLKQVIEKLSPLFV